MVEREEIPGDRGTAPRADNGSRIELRQDRGLCRAAGVAVADSRLRRCMWVLTGLGTTAMGARRGNPGLRGRLLNSSIDAYILSLDTINRLSVRYRVENFAYLICNAWELLLKASAPLRKSAVVV